MIGNEETRLREEIAARGVKRVLCVSADVSVRTVKDILANEMVQHYFLRYRVRRMMTSNGVRTAGITLLVRMDDPLTPEDQAAHEISENEHWYTPDFGPGEDSD